jgi:hypothetical protein
MRTTVRLPESLLGAAKRHAVQTGRTRTQLIEDGVRAELQRGSGPKRVAESLPTYRGKGLRPGVDLTDSRSLEDFMSES